MDRMSTFGFVQSAKVAGQGSKPAQKKSEPQKFQMDPLPAAASDDFRTCLRQLTFDPPRP